MKCYDEVICSAVTSICQAIWSHLVHADQVLAASVVLVHSVILIFFFSRVSHQSSSVTHQSTSITHHSISVSQQSISVTHHFISASHQPFSATHYSTSTNRARHLSAVSGQRVIFIKILNFRGRASPKCLSSTSVMLEQCSPEVYRSWVRFRSLLIWSSDGAERRTARLLKVKGFFPR